MAFQHRISLSEEQQAFVRRDPGAAERRFREWMAKQQNPILDGPAIFPDRIELTATIDPAPAWAVASLATPDQDEVQNVAIRNEVTTLLAALEANTATTAQMRRALFLLLRHAAQTVYKNQE